MYLYEAVFWFPSYSSASWNKNAALKSHLNLMYDTTIIKVKKKIKSI